MQQKQYPNVEILSDWKKLVTMNREDVVELHEQWIKIAKLNEQIRDENLEVNKVKLDEIIEVMRSNGIDVYKYKYKGLYPQKNGFQPWFKKNVSEVVCKYESHKSYPYVHNCEKVVDGIRLYNNSSPTNLIEFYDRISMQYNSGIRKVNQENKLLIKSIEYAKEYGIDIYDLPTNEIIKKVDNFARGKFIEDNFKDGDDVYLDDNKCECETWHYGEHRCSCGNRRCYLEVDGDILKGYDYYVEVY